jgi:hypothetical protein
MLVRQRLITGLVLKQTLDNVSESVCAVLDSLIAAEQTQKIDESCQKLKILVRLRKPID